jgi:DNA invertase Pin-like site-specific DNA recombinase
VDAVVVYRYDRFAGSLRQLVNALEEFRSLGIDFVSLHEGVDTSTPNGRLVFGIFATIAEFERELIRDRVRSGLASARAKGKRLGRPGPKRTLHRLPVYVILGRPGELLQTSWALASELPAERLWSVAKTLAMRSR